jgi:hypothetical protein
MEENIFDAIPGFDRLLEEKTFEALSGRERDQVLQFISREDYNRFREAVLVAQHGMHRREPHITPDPSVKNRLMQQFGSESTPPSGSIFLSLSRLLNHRIPFYQAAIAASVLLFMVIFLLLQNPRMPLRMAVADTVYVDRPMLIKDTVWLEKSEENSPETERVSHSQPETRDHSFAQSINENPLYTRQVDEAMRRMSVISGLGKDKSVNHDAGLMKLVAMGMAIATSP